jgi:hypothetical protein
VRGVATDTRADVELERMIEKRTPAGVRDPDLVEPSYQESVKRYTAKIRAAVRAEWADFHEGQAARLERTASSLAAEHRAKAARLREES